MSYDQFWSVFAMPIGVLVCFGPLIVAWLVAEYRRPRKDDSASPPKPQA